MCLPSRASRSAVRSRAIRWSRCSSWDMNQRANHRHTCVMSQSPPQTRPTLPRHRGLRHRGPQHSSYTTQTGCLNLRRHATKSDPPCLTSTPMCDDASYPCDLWQASLCGCEEVSQRGLQLPVQLERQVHVHRTLLNHLTTHTDTQTCRYRGQSTGPGHASQGSTP